MPQQPAGFVPDGFEPDTSVAPTWTPRNPLTQPHVVSDTPPTSWGARFGAQLRQELETAAHPQTISDFAQLVLPETSAPGRMIGKTVQAASAITKPIMRGATKAAGAVADMLSPDVVSVVSPRGGAALRVLQRVRDAAAKTAAPMANVPPRLVKAGAPKLEHVLGAILDEAKGTPLETPSSVPIGAPGGAQAAADTMRGLSETRPEVLRGQPPAQPAPVQAAVPHGTPTDLRWANMQRSGNMDWNVGGQTPTELSYEALEARAKPPAGPVVDLSAQTRGPSAAQARAAERFGKVYTSEGGPGRPSAMTQVQQTSQAAKLKLTADEMTAAAKLVKSGKDPVDVLEAIKAHRALKASPAFANLPTDAEMATAVRERNVKGAWAPGSTGPAEVLGNPFRQGQ